MGRAKLKMEFMTNEKARNSTFQKRKKGLKKKAYELATLCDVEVSMIIFSPKQNDHPSEPEIWPSNPSQIHSMIESYKKRSDQDRAYRTLDLSNFFKERTKKAEDQLLKLRKKNDSEAMYPTWDSRYNTLSEESLRGLSDVLKSKIEGTKARLEFMKANQSLELIPAALLDYTQMQSSQNQSYYMQDMVRRNNLQLKAIQEQPISSFDPRDYDLPFRYHQFDQNQKGQIGSNSNSMMRMMMDDSYYNQLGGASTSNAMYGPMDGPIYVNPLNSGMLDTMMANNNPRPTNSMQYYNPSMEVMPQYMHYSMMPSTSSQAHAPSQLDQYYEVGDFQMKNENEIH